MIKFDIHKPFSLDPIKHEDGTTTYFDYKYIPDAGSDETTGEAVDIFFDLIRERIGRDWERFVSIEIKRIPMETFTFGTYIGDAALTCKVKVLDERRPFDVEAIEKEYQEERQKMEHKEQDEQA